MAFDATSSIEEQFTSISSEYGRVRAYWVSNLGNKAAAAAVNPNLLVTVSRNVASPVRFGASQVARRASDKQESDLRGSSSQYSKQRVDYVPTISSNSYGLVTHDNNVHGLNFNTSPMRIFRHTATTPAELNKISPTATVSMERHATLKGFTDDLVSVSLEASRLNILLLQRSNKSYFVNPDLDENMTKESHYKLFPTESQIPAESSNISFLLNVSNSSSAQWNDSASDARENFLLLPTRCTVNTRNSSVPNRAINAKTKGIGSSSTIKGNASKLLQPPLLTMNRLNLSSSVSYESLKTHGRKMTSEGFSSLNSATTELLMKHDRAVTSAKKRDNSQNKALLMPHEASLPETAAATSHVHIGLFSNNSALFYNNFITSDVSKEDVKNVMSFPVSNTSSGKSLAFGVREEGFLKNRLYFKTNSSSAKSIATVNYPVFSKQNMKILAKKDPPLNDTSSSVRQNFVILDQEFQDENVNGTRLYCSLQLKYETSLPNDLCDYFVVYKSVIYDTATKALELVASDLWRTVAESLPMETGARVLPVVDTAALNEVMQDYPLAKRFATAVSRLFTRHGITGLAVDLSTAMDVNVDSYCSEVQKYVYKRHFVGLINYDAAERLFRSTLSKLASAMKSLLLRNNPARGMGIATSVPNPFSAASVRAYTLENAMRLVEGMKLPAESHSQVCLSLSLRVLKYEVVNLGLEPQGSIGIGSLASDVDKFVPYSKVCQDYVMTPRTFDEKSLSTYMSHKKEWLGFDDPITVKMKVI
ncbi:unnamed protein product [Ixodes pacificus]